MFPLYTVWSPNIWENLLNITIFIFLSYLKWCSGICISSYVATSMQWYYGIRYPRYEWFWSFWGFFSDMFSQFFINFFGECRECRERFPRQRGLAIPTCITTRASRTCRDACRDRELAVSFEFGVEENILRTPGACATRNFTYMVRGPLHVPNVIIIVINTLRPRQNGHQFTDDIIKYIFLNENVWVSIKISLEFVPRGPVNNTPVLVQIMTWRRPGDKPLSEPMGASSLTHICVSRPRWVKAWETNSGVSLLHFMAKYGLFTCVHHFYLLQKNYNMSDISAIDVWHSNGIHLSLIFRHSFFDFFSNTYFPSFSENKCF